MKNYLLRYIRTHGQLDFKLLSLLRDNEYDTIDSALTRKVIEDIVLTDLNLVSGRQLTVALSDCDIVEQTSKDIIVEVPEEIRLYSTISGARAVFANEKYGGYLAKDSRGKREFTLQEKIAGRSNISENTIVNVLTDRHVLIQSDNINTSMLQDSYLVIDVEYTTAFETIGRDYYPSMGKICVDATKMLIYNMRLEVADGLVDTYGSTSLLEAVNSFDSAALDYEKDLDTLGLIAFANDERKMDDFITYMI